MKKAFLFAFLILALAALLNVNAIGTKILFVANQLSAVIVVDDFQISKTPFTQGETVSFSITFENTGNVETTATGHVYIFNSANTLVDSFDYTATSIAPDQQKVQIKDWPSGTLAADTYTAKANVTFIPYNSSVDYSNTLTTTFQITAPGGGGGGGGSWQREEVNPLKPILPTKPVILPPEIKPILGGPVDFVSFPVLKEIVAGQSTIQSISFTNSRATTQSVKLSVQGVAADWVSTGSSETDVLPGETRNVDVAFSAPKNAPAGDYLVRFDVDNALGKTAEFMVLRVKSSSEGSSMPLVLRTINVDRKSGNTVTIISLRNQADKTLDRITFQDYLPKELENYQLTFLDKPGEVRSVNGNKVVVLDVAQLLPKEEMRMSYQINEVLPNYAPYANWYNYNIEISKRVDLSSLVQIMDLSASAFERGGKGQVTATILYVGENPLEATMTLEAPAGFVVEPSYMTVNLQPRTTFTARFDVTPPTDAVESQLVRFVLYTEDGQVSARLPLVITPEAEPTAAGQLAIQFKPSDIALAGVLVIALIFGYLFVRGRGKERGGARFSEERLEYAKSLSKLVKAD